MTDYKMLVKEAYEAQKMAYIPYSHWAVGAALLTKDGKIYRGCNIESSTFTPTVCAERTAFFKAVSEGERNFAAIAIVGNDEKTPVGQGDFCPPCGVCRQALAEFCGPELEILLVRSAEETELHTLGELLPLAFTPASLAQGEEEAL